MLSAAPLRPLTAAIETSPDSTTVTLLTPSGDDLATLEFSTRDHVRHADALISALRAAGCALHLDTYSDDAVRARDDADGADLARGGF